MTSPQDPGPVRKFFGWLLMAVGGLIALTTGACTLYVLAGLAANGSGGYGSTGGWVLLSLIFGGLPCLIGIGVFLGGRAMAGRPKIRQLPPRPVEELDDAPQ